MLSLDKKDEAIKLRKQGFSYSYISNKINVAKSTLSLWLREVSFVPNEFTKSLIERGQKGIVKFNRSDKFNSLNIASSYAESEIKSLSNRDIFILGIGIYIGEGSKTGNLVRVVNSDPRIIKFMIKWFKKCFNLNDTNFKIRIHIYPDTNESDVLNFWIKNTGLNKNRFHSSYVDRRINKKTKKNKILPYGTAHLSIVGDRDSVPGALLHRKILASIDRVLK